MGLSITTKRLADGTVEIRPRGEIDLANAGELRGAVQDALAGWTPPRILVDLWQVTLVDSVAIGAMVASYRAASARGVPLMLANPSPMVYRQLWLAGLIELFGSPEPFRGAR